MSPEQTRHKTYSHRFELVIGFTLLLGVVATAGFLMVGFLWRLASGLPPQHVYIAATFAGLWKQSLRAILDRNWHPIVFIDLGLACLLATPYLRVVISVVYFAVAERNAKYGLITLFVLSFLTYNLFF